MGGTLIPSSVRERVIGLALQILGRPPTPQRLPSDVPLRELGMSSMQMVNLMLAAEAAFDLTIPESEIRPENFLTIGTIEALILRLG
jgi:acyl carrier protein